jgi:uncharacterized protein YwqG
MLTVQEQTKLVKAIREARLQSHADKIASRARSAIRLRPSSSDHPASWLGGSPVMPAAMEWPRWKDRHQAFIAHVSLAHVAPHDKEEVLPKTGRLLFFYDAAQETWGFDPADRGSWSVVYVEDGALCSARSAPDGVPTFSRVSLEPISTINIPPWESLVFNGLGIADTELDAYDALVDTVNGTNAIVHKLLGYADPLQNSMEAECQLASNGIYCGDSHARNHPRASELLPGSTDWRLLLQIDSEDKAAMMWGDSGRLYYWIREADLRRRHFDDTWFVLQCC